MWLSGSNSSLSRVGTRATAAPRPLLFAGRLVSVRASGRNRPLPRATPTDVPEGFLSRESGSESDSGGAAPAPAVAAPRAPPQPQRPQAVGQLRSIPEGMLSLESATDSDSDSNSSGSNGEEAAKAPAVTAAPPQRVARDKQDGGGHSAGSEPPQPRAVPEGWLSHEED